MAKDDYDVIAYKILIYLYACMKRIVAFDTETFNAVIDRKNLNEQYLADIFRLMQGENLIKGIAISRVCGKDYVITSDIRDLEITVRGIRYLNDEKTERVKRLLLETKDITAGLIVQAV